MQFFTVLDFNRDKSVFTVHTVKSEDSVAPAMKEIIHQFKELDHDKLQLISTILEKHFIEKKASA